MAQRLARYAVVVAIQGVDAAPRIEVEPRLLTARHFAVVPLVGAGEAAAGGWGRTAGARAAGADAVAKSPSASPKVGSVPPPVDPTSPSWPPWLPLPTPAATTRWSLKPWNQLIEVLPRRATFWNTG